MSKHHKHIIPEETVFEIREIDDPDDYSYAVAVTQIIKDKKNGKLFSVNLPYAFETISDAMQYINVVAAMTCDESTLHPYVSVYDGDGNDLGAEYLPNYVINECEGFSK